MNDTVIDIIESGLDTAREYLNSLSTDKKKRVAKLSTHVRNGLYALAPLTCHGPDKCPFIAHCPIPEIVNGERELGELKDYPVDRACILESIFIKQKTIDYIKYLKIDSENPIEMSVVNDLALIDLYKNRAVMILSSGDRDEQGMDFLRIDITKLIDNGNGNDQMMATSSTQLHPAFQVIEMLEKRREKLLTNLIETRKAQSDLAIKMGKRKEDSQLMQELKRTQALLAAQQMQVQQIVTKEELIPLKD